MDKAGREEGKNMDTKAFEEFNKFVGKDLIGASLNGNALTLTFEKKFLFIKGKKSFRLSARESLANLSLKALEGKNLKEVRLDPNDFVSLKFVKEGEPVFTLGFKLREVEAL